MVGAMRNLPIGIQTFEKIRESNDLYVDKTEYVFRLVHSGAPYFLSRPRRFGKSLLLSTMRAYWEGRKELFSGLVIERLEAELEASDPEGAYKAWQEYPVFYFDFNRDDFTRDGALEDVLVSHLEEWEAKLGRAEEGSSLAARFQRLLRKAVGETGRRCVVLIDEYDKSLLETMHDKKLIEHNKAVFKGFFSSLKSEDAYIKFIFITGVTKFSKVSIFSDLNQLRDISLNEEYAGICGITDEELRDNFAPEIERMAEAQGLTCEECYGELRRTYDGYRFHPDAPGVYNPFSLLNAFADRELGSYWFSSGTPTFLVRQIRANSFDIRRLTNNTIYSSEAALTDYSGEDADLVPLLYQTGYLTIVDYDRRKRRYTLSVPNEEVKYGLLDSLMPAYVPRATAGSGLDIFTFEEYIENADLDGVRNVITALFANISYTTHETTFEHYFQAVIYLLFTLLGRLVICEQHTYTGRIDCVVQTDDYIYIFEFKRDDSAESALRQIDEMHYVDPYAADPRKLYKIGANFSSETRQLDGWEVGG